MGKAIKVYKVVSVRRKCLHEHAIWISNELVRHYPCVSQKPDHKVHVDVKGREWE